MSTSSVTTQNRDIYSNYYVREVYSEANFCRFWFDREKMKALTQPFPLLNLRTEALKHLSRIPGSLPNKILGKYFSYELKKNFLDYTKEPEKSLTKETMDKMAVIFAKTYMNPLLHGVLKIQETLPQVTDHFHKFQTFLNPEYSEGTDAVIAFVKEMRELRTILQQNLGNLSIKTTEIDERIQMYMKQGKKIGPSFQTNPACFLQGTPIKVLDNSALQASTLVEAVEMIEQIKQHQSVAEGAYHFYRLLLNATRSLRNVEQGMANALEKHFNLPSTFQRRNFATMASWMSAPSATFPPYPTEKAEQIVSCLRCPITNKLFEDPVILVETGHSYERATLQTTDGLRQLFAINNSLFSVTTVPNLTLKAVVQRFRGSSSIQKFLQIAPEFLSPITFHPLKDPYIVSSGISYEKAEAERVAQCQHCVVTNTPITSKQIVKNETFLQLMQACR